MIPTITSASQFLCFESKSWTTAKFIASSENHLISHF
jgi:hypothetical protein